MVMARTERLEYRGIFKELGAVLPSTQLKSKGKTNPLGWECSRGGLWRRVCAEGGADAMETLASVQLGLSALLLKLE